MFEKIEYSFQPCLETKSCFKESFQIRSVFVLLIVIIPHILLLFIGRKEKIKRWEKENEIALKE